MKERSLYWKKPEYYRRWQRDRRSCRSDNEIFAAYMYHAFWRWTFPEKFMRYFRSKKGKDAASRYELSAKRKSWQKQYCRIPKIRARMIAANAKRRSLCKTSLSEIRKINCLYRKAQQWRQWGFDVCVDHIMPISKGGKHSIDNVQIIYAHENRLKHTKHDFVPSIIFL